MGDSKSTTVTPEPPLPAATPPPREEKKPREIGGPKGPEPTRYGDWEVNGRCIDF
jgi:hypothetical protein